MSRSCQSATFSSPTSALARTTRASPQIRSATTGFFLCGIADEPFCPWPKRLLDLGDLGPGEVPDLERELLERSRADGQRGQQLSVPVALDDLRRGRRRLEPELLAGQALHLGVGRRVRADGARELADADPLERAAEPLSGAVELEGPDGELEAEGRRLGVHAVRAADHQRVAVLLRPSEDGVEGALDPGENQPARLADLQSERGVDDVGGREPVVEPATLRAEPVGNGVDERRQVVLGLLLELGDASRGGWAGCGADLARPQRPERPRPRPTHRALRARPRASARACPPPTRSSTWPGGSSGKSLSGV